MHIKASFKGAVISYIVLFILAIVLSIYYHFGSLSSVTLNYLVSFSIATAFLLGGFSGGYSTGEKGLMTGIMSALMAILFVFVIVSLGTDAPKDWMRFLINTAFALAAAGVGGIIGVSKN